MKRVHVLREVAVETEVVEAVAAVAKAVAKAVAVVVRVVAAIGVVRGVAADVLKEKTFSIPVLHYLKPPEGVGAFCRFLPF